MARVKAFRAEYGLSAEIKGIWHKFYTAIEIELTEGDDITEVKEKAWNTVINECEKQIKDLQV